MTIDETKDAACQLGAANVEKHSGCPTVNLLPNKILKNNLT